MDSLNSEGITFKRPKSAPSRLRGPVNRKPTSSRNSKEPFDLNLDILRTFEEPSETIQRRMELYEQNLEKLQGYLQRGQDKLNDDLNVKLTNFIQSSFDLIEKVGSVIPIGILESSLSIGENAALFDYVEERIKGLSGDGQIQDKVFVARVHSGGNSSTKSVFQKICAQLINDESYEDEDTENDDSSPTKKDVATAPKRGRQFSLYDVKSFLSSVKHNYKIVLILEDVDFFANSIITQILTLLGCAKLPLVFIFGVTHGHFIQNLVPSNCSSEFVLERFYSVSPKERFNEFMRRVLMDPTNAFRVSGPIVSYLESQYNEDSFSVEHIFRSLKFCLHYHFLAGKATFCSLQKADDYSERELQLFKEVVEVLNSPGVSPRKRMKLKLKAPEELINASVDDLKAWHFFLRLLCFFNLRLPDCPLGQSYSSIYASCFDGYSHAKESDEHEPFYRFFKTLGSLSKLDIQTILEDCTTYFKKGSNLPDLDWANDVLVEFEQIVNKIVNGDKEVKENTEDPSAAAKKTLKIRKTKSLKELQQSLLEVKRKNEGSIAVHEARTQLVESLRKLLKKFFPAFALLKHSEIFVFTDLNQLINALYPANFLQLNEDITSPGYVLQCDCCSDLDVSSIDANLPDVSIVQKLLSEHTTKKVDLNLIYHAFVSVVQPTKTGRKPKASASKDAATASTLIRFRRAVGELQHMGFVKRAKSKPDEVNRLTWW